MRKYSGGYRKKNVCAINFPHIFIIIYVLTKHTHNIVYTYLQIPEKSLSYIPTAPIIIIIINNFANK